MKKLSVVAVSLFAIVALNSCASKQHSKGEYSKEEVSLKADRSEYDQLRKDMPAEVKKENDELAGILQLLRNPQGDYEKPERIREKFNKIMRDKRSRMDKQLREEREDFSRLEKEQREEFTENQKKEKDDFLDDKPSSEARKRFFDKQQTKRARFYDDSREKRRSFEAQISTRRKDFEDYVREKTNLFNQEYRNYQREYDERMKGEDLKRRTEKKGKASGTQPDLSGSTDMSTPSTTNEFNEIPQEGTQLGTEGN